MAGRSNGDVPVDMWQNMSRMDDNVMEEIVMLDVFALIATLFIGFGLGGVAIAVFMYALDKMQNGGRDDTR
jgi:hypothetical protein